MADPEHMKILNQGVDYWNKWREDNPNIQPDLCGAILQKRFYLNWNLIGVNFSDTNLDGVDLYRTDLSRSNLSGASLLDTYLGYANLRYSDFEDALFGETMLGHTDLSNASGLDSCTHAFPSFIDPQTIIISGGLPIEFLRGCGVPEPFIVHIPALVASSEPIQFYACFISFTEADDAFSERLYNDLQSKVVRCWRWKEDAKWGKSLMRSIDEAVRVYDKLIVICTEQSLNSPAVIREIERSLQKEDELARQGKESEVLFPIQLDDYIFTGWNHHLKADVVAKNVGNFRQWNEPEQYKKAFDRLLSDLKAEEKKS